MLSLAVGRVGPIFANEVLKDCSHWCASSGSGVVLDRIVFEMNIQNHRIGAPLACLKLARVELAKFFQPSLLHSGVRLCLPKES